MKNEQLFEQSKNDVRDEKIYNIADVDLREILDPNGKRMIQRQERWNTRFTMNIAPDLTIFDQQLRTLPDGGLRTHQREAIKLGNLQKAWTETLAVSLSNVIDNAAQGREDFVLGETPNIIINAYKQGNELIIEVKDDGDGIPQHILDGLAQGAKKVSTKAEGRGGGLGLISTRESMHQLGGTMEIKTVRKEDVKHSEPTGTTIRFIFQINTKK
ncbi:MAG: ATP-binding protein [bacterium]|nr:ATP-binding protein [bacterium]